MDISKAVEVFVKIRDAKEAKIVEHEAEIDVFNTKLNTIGAALLAHMKETGETSCKTKMGTAIRQKRTRYWSPDREAFNQFVKTYGAYDLFENRIHQGNYKQFLEDNPDVKPPVNSDSKYVINVRRGKGT